MWNFNQKGKEDFESLENLILVWLALGTTEPLVLSDNSVTGSAVGRSGGPLLTALPSGLATPQRNFKPGRGATET